jgi:hypothetical protein
MAQSTEVHGRTVALRAFYPSTMLRMVPLPMSKLMGRLVTP